jgi:hypothetical protein
MNQKKIHRIFEILTLLIAVSLAVAPLQVSAHNTVSAGMNTGSYAPGSVTPSLALFIEQVKNGLAEQITGLYIKNTLSYPVVQQPAGQPAFVSPNADLITQFLPASAYGSLGFLAHNNLAGSKFPEIRNGNIISVIYGDGHFIQYQVSQIRRFQALQPNNPYSSFIDLSNNQALTVQEIFNQTYGVRDQLILQTCIADQGIDSWGRLFIIAVPYTPVTLEIAFPYILATME